MAKLNGEWLKEGTFLRQKRKVMNVGRLAAACFLIATVGCATTAGKNLTDLDPDPGRLRPGIEQTVGEFSFHLDGGKMVTSNKVGRILNDEILGRWQKSGFIAGHEYVPSSQFSEGSLYRITLSGHQEGESSILLQVLSGLSLLVIPYYVDQQMTLQFSLEQTETRCRFEAKAYDSYTTIVGLLLIPLTPFSQFGRLRTLDRLSDHLYAQLAEQGAFEEHSPCSSGLSPKVSSRERLRELESLRGEGLVSEPEYLRKRQDIIDDL